LFKVTKTGLAAGAATVALAASGIGVGVVSAGASTTKCDNATGKLAGSCGDLVNRNGYGLSVILGADGKADLNDRVGSSNDVTGSDTTDFYASQTNGNDNERVLEYAPKAKRSGLCVTQPSARSGLRLRSCGTADASQEFYGIGDTQDDTGNSNGGLQWVNAATGDVISITKQGITLEPLTSSSKDKSSYLHWVQ
jgi:hypothetical protein